MKKLGLLILILLAFALVPAAMAYPSSYDSSIQVQNLSDSSPATIELTFYNQDGTIDTQVTDTVGAGRSNTYFPIQASSGFNGSVVISSDQSIAAIVNVVADNITFGASYGGFDTGAQSVSLPLIMKNNSGFSTWFNVQNTDTANDTTVTVNYAGTACSETKTVKAGSAQTFDQSTNSCLPGTYVGAATATAAPGGSIVATAVEVGDTTLFAYNGFAAGGANNPVVPLVNANNSGYITGIQIQNVGNTDTSVTITYTPAGAGNGTACFETKNVPDGESRTFALYAFTFTGDPQPGTDNCAQNARFVGSASVTTNSTSQPLVGIVNQLNLGASKGSSYNAFNPTTATGTVVMPLIMDRNSGFYTGINVMNVGAVNTSVTCNYISTDGTFSKSYTSSMLTPGAAFNQIHATYDFPLKDKFVGSGTCTANAANGKIVAQVNELGSTSGDTLFTYEGFNN